MSKEYPVIHVDDFGISEDNVLHISHLINEACVGAVSIIPNGKAYTLALESLKRESFSLPTIEVWAHLDFVENEFLTKENLTEKSFKPISFTRLLLAYLLPYQTRSRYQEIIFAEASAQVQRLQKDLFPLKIAGIDTHMHTHGIPWIHHTLAQVAEINNIKQIRSTYEPFGLIRIYDLFNRHFLFGLPKLIFLNLVRSQRLDKRCVDPIYGILFSGHLNLRLLDRYCEFHASRYDGSKPRVIVHPGKSRTEEFDQVIRKRFVRWHTSMNRLIEKETILQFHKTIC